MAVSISSGGSDYLIGFSYSGANVVACSDAVVHEFSILKNSDTNSVQKISGSGSKSSGGITYVAGPSNSGWWGLRYGESEDCGLVWCNCVAWVWSGYPRATSSTKPSGYSVLTYAATAAIKSPTGISASNQQFFDKITIGWGKGTNIPDGNVQYKIYRGTTLGNRTLVHTASGSARSWTDNSIVPNDVYYYWVTTYTPSWGVHQSPMNNGNAVVGRAKTFGVVASDGLYTSRVKISWDDLSDFAEEIRVERGVPNSSVKEELDILSKNAQAYSDSEAIPGFNYTYYITPIQESRTFPSLSEQGYRKPNGTIKGAVKSLVGAGVEGVTVCAKPITSGLPAGAVPMPSSGYCATTDIDGYFEIRNIYYFEEAEFEIVPAKAGPVEPHIFSPDAIKRTIDLNSKLSSGVNFTDESVFTVAGKVTYPVSSTGAECGVPDVEIKFNGESRGIFTNANGDWSYAIQDEGTYTFTPELLHHHFENSTGQTSTTLQVNSDHLDIDFLDLEVDDILVKVQGGCGDPVADAVTLRVTSSNNCYNKTYTTDANGLLTLSNLPAREYSVQVIALDPVNSGILDQIGNKPIIIDLTVRDTAEVVSENENVTITPADTIHLPNGSMSITPADTVHTAVSDTTRGEVIPKAEFIYHSPLNITTDFIEAGAEVAIGCTNSDGDEIIIMEQNNTYSLVFDVSEQLGNCPIEEGVLRIFDFVSDRGDEPIEVPIVNGFATYHVNAGLPELATSVAHNHEKLLYVIPEIGFTDAEPIEYWITVNGVKTQAPSFITQSPDLPMLILHDPPGDNSYAKVEKGAEFKSFETNEVLVGGEAGFFLDMILGGTFISPFSRNGLGVLLKFSAVAGRDNFNRSGIETTITFNESFSTSDLDNLTGNDGDVYIGASFNQVFAFGDQLTYDKNTCKADIEVIPTIDVNGFATTFVYTEHHIKNTLIPKLGELRTALIGDRTASQLSEEEKLQANQLLYDSIHWEKVIAQNTANRDTTAVFQENISFNAGAVYSKEYTSSITNSTSYEYNTFVNLEFAVGIKAINESGIWYESEGGITGKFRWATTTNTGSDITSSRTVGYVFDDGDIGDFFSVDVKEDIAYGVPSFTLKSGTSSCPHEPGSQPRDDARIQILPPQINNVPIGGKAVFLANLLNESQSRETREYHVRAISTTNPDGAVLSIGGKQINNNAASFWLDFNQTSSIALTVERGPLASTYDSIGIMMFPPCEYSLWENNGNITSSDTAWIFVDFQSQCSNVALHLPGDGWLVNQNNNDILNVAFTGYDLNNEMLESVTLQYKKEGQGWIDQITYKKGDLFGNFFDYAFDVTNLDDGSYRVRAKAYCGIEGGLSYSSEQSGIIDRTSLAPFGTPSPADGFLRLGQEISVTYDKDINCDFGSYDPELSQAYIKLFLDDGTEVPISVQCSESQDGIIIVPDVDLFTQAELEGVELTAVIDSIQDVNGNVQKYSTQWSFLVNVSPVSWNPEAIFVSAVETDDVVLAANLDNNAVLNKAFTITQWPDWITPSVTSASILSGNSFNVQFDVVEDLLPGLYEGQVTALIDDVPEVLDISLELYAVDIGWTLNSPDFQYNMNIAAQFSSDESDIALSTGLRDKIAAYVNGELRGIGEISYVPELNKYAAFINVNSNLVGKNGSFFEAEDNIDHKGAKSENVTDDGVNSRASKLKKREWVEFDVFVTKDGTYSMDFRVSSKKSGQSLDLLVDDDLKASLSVPNTGDKNIFTTLNTNISLVEGKHVLRIYSPGSELYLNWFNFPEYHVRDLNSLEVIKFRMWDGLNGIEYGGVEELTFFNDGIVGNAQDPFIIHPAGGIQEVPLAKGWTWISVNKESDDMSVYKVFESITPPTSPNDITLKSQSAFSQYTLGTDWQGSISDIDIRKAYMIHLNNNADTLSMIGNSPESDVSISLTPKWNWIGFPKSGILGVNDVLSDVDATAGDIVKSQFEFAEYNDATDTWIGDMDFFQPGRGYKLFVSNAGSIEGSRISNSEELHLKHEYNMTMTATIDFGSIPFSENHKLHAYINGQFRGEISVVYSDELEKYMSFIMIYGDRADIGEEVQVKLWDDGQEEELALSPSNITFGIDQIEGSLSDPVYFNILDEGAEGLNLSQLNVSVYPNPFANQTLISYFMPSKSRVVLTVINSIGEEISRFVDIEQEPGHYEFNFNARDLPSGIYFCNIETDDYFETKKLILITD